MAITNYTELQTAISTWTHRSDLSSVTADFVKLAESYLNNTISVQQMEATTSLAVSSSTVALPSDFLKARRLYIDASYKSELQYLAPEIFHEKFSVDASDIPSYYTIEAGNIVLGTTPDTTATVELLYIQRIPDLETNTTNWLLTDYPDIYLWSCLLQAGKYIRDNDLIALATNETDKAIKLLLKADKNTRWTGSNMRVIAS